MVIRQIAQKPLPLPGFLDIAPIEPKYTDEDWSLEGADTQESTHILHTYVAAMIPQLARKLIESYVPKRAVVFDPFCGGGAVLGEAIRAGREAVGREINLLGVLVSKAKTTYLDVERIIEAGEEVLTHAKVWQGEPITFRKADYVDFWFKQQMMKPLTALRRSIDRLTESPEKDLMRVLFSATIRNVSLTRRNEVRLRRMPPKERDNFNPDVFEKFREKLREAITRIPALPVGANADVAMADVRKLSFRNEEFSSIVCSPPYGDERNGVNYTQFTKNMLYWLGYSREEQMNSKKLSLGWRKENKAAPPSRTLLAALEAIDRYPASQKEAIAFYADYYIALRQMARVTRDRTIIVIGQRVLQNTVFDNAQITVELMADLGVPLETVRFRRLPSKRLPKMREFGAAIDHESILVFKK